MSYDVIRQTYIDLTKVVATLANQLAVMGGEASNEIIMVKKNGDLYVVTDDDISWLSQSFPGLDVATVVRRLVTWNNDQPKRSRKQDFRRFARNNCQREAEKLAKQSNRGVDIYELAEGRRVEG